MVIGWCPDTNFFENHITTKDHFADFSNVNVYLESMVEFNDKIVSNDKKEVPFPGKHANMFNLGTLIDTIGFSNRSIRDVGAIVKVKTEYKC